MKIEWMGHSSFIITVDSGKKICTDPYQSGSYDGAVGYAPIKERVDIVTVSHDHADHSGTGELLGNFEVVKTVGEFKIEGINIEGVSTYHDRLRGDERGDNIVFKICTGTMKIAHLGDLGHLMGESEMEKLGRIDILMIPIGGHFTIDGQDAWDIIGHIKPKIVIPMHYKTEKLGFPIAGVGEFLSGTDNVQHVDDLELSRADLPQDTTVYVLKHKR